MRLFYICHVELHTNVGGARHVMEVVKHLGLLGHRVELFAPKTGNPRPEMKNVRIVYVPTIRTRILSWVVFYSLSFFCMWFRGRKESPDLIYAREMTYNLFLPLLSTLLGCPLIVEVNALILDEMKMFGEGKTKLALARFCQRHSLLLSDRILAVTDGIKTGLVQAYGVHAGRISVVPNGTDPEHFRPMDMVKCRREVGLDTRAPIVGFVGSCYPYHDVKCLIEAAPLVSKEFKDTRFVIVGDGSMRRVWKDLTVDRRLSDSFFFVGAAPYEKVPYYMNAFTICVAPFTRQRNENSGLSPLKLYDYMACGKAVVSNQLQDLGDLIEGNRAGKLVPPEDPVSLAGAILELLGDQGLREEMGRNGRALVEKQYTWEATTKRIVELWSELFEERG